MKNTKVRLILIALTMSTFLGVIGCGQPKETDKQKTQQIQQAENDIAENSNAENSNVENSDAENGNLESSTDETKESFSDFYEYVNGDFIKEVEENQWMSEEGVYDNYQTKVMNTVDQWLEADYHEFEDDPRMYALMLFNYQLKHLQEYKESSKSALMQDVQRIYEIKNLEQLYTVYGEEPFCIANGLWNYKVELLDGFYYTYISPKSVFAMVSPDHVGEIEEKMISMLLEVGFEKSQAEKIAKNATQMDKKINEYLQNHSSEDYYYWNQEWLAENGINLPIGDTLDSLHMLSSHKKFLLYESYPDFLQDIYKEENAEMLRDHMIVCYLAAYANVISDEMTYSYLKGLYELGDYDFSLYDKDQDKKEFILYLAPGIIGDYYVSHMMDHDTVTQFETIVDDVTKGMHDIISDSDWLTNDGQKLSRRKLNTMDVLLGTDGYENVLDEVASDIQEELTPYENFKNIRHGFRTMNSKLLYNVEQKHVIKDANPYINNAFYHGENNTVIVYLPYGKRLQDYSETSYETKLGLTGTMLAHEFAHAYDTNGVEWDETGYYDHWLPEEDTEKHTELMERIAKFFDGKETGYGNVINGQQVKNESFCDLIAIECCLKILEKRENPNYADFFKAYVKQFEIAYDSEYDKYLVESDIHVPCRERVNWTLAQFDLFYETFDVDPNSVYFVPKEERIRIGCKNQH